MSAIRMVEPTAIAEFDKKFKGDLLQPSHPKYDQARRVYNGMIDNRPALIARCLDIEDVIAALALAREQNLAIAVRGGGHSIAGFSTIDDGIVIDLGQMKRVEVDAGRRRARAQAGVTWAEFDGATQAHGLATTGGFVSTTGIAGLTLGGGIGFLSRKYGLSCDNLISAEVVTADGRIVRASEDENADLLWGLRGGGGNFGIVTQFEYALHEVSEVTAALIIHQIERGADLMGSYRELSSALPDELLSGVIYMQIPENPLFPEELHGRKVSGILAAYLGGMDEALPALAPLRQGHSPVQELVMPVPYQMVQQMQDEDAPWGIQNYWKSGFMDELSDQAIETIADRAPTATSRRCQVSVFGLGGAISKVGENDSAYSNRDAAYSLQIDNIWEDPAENEDQIAWSRSFFDAVTPHLSKGVYLNFIGDEGNDRVRNAYGEDKYRRLVELKDRYDPENVFELNQNIKPSK